MKKAARALAGVWAVLPLVLADRLTKAWAAHSLTGRGALQALPGLVNWHYAENTGAAFSSLSGRTALLSIFTAVLVGAVIAYLFLRPDTPRLMRTGLWLLAAGGLSNLFDRLAYGYVVDFIEFAFVRFAVFNVADVGICLGAGLAVLGYARLERQAKGEGAHG